MTITKNRRLERLKRRARKVLLVARVLFMEFREFFCWFATAVLLSTTLFYFFYPAQTPDGHLHWSHALYSTWMMLFFESPINYVTDWRISWLFFFLPLLGLITIAEGVVHLGNLLFQHKRYSSEWQKMIAASMENHMVVCGLGNVGVRVVQHLRRADESCVVIEQSADSRFMNEVAGYDVPVLVGDARDVKLLQQANIAKAKALIAVTDDDLVNLAAALSAREFNPTIRVVIRMFDQKLAKMVEKSLGINSAYSSSARSSRLFAQAAINGNIIDSFEFGGTTINAFQLVIEPNTILVGQTVDDIRGKHEVTVLMQEKTDGTLDWNPSPVNSLEVGDRLLIMTDSEGIDRLKGSMTKLSIPRDGSRVE